MAPPLYSSEVQYVRAPHFMQFRLRSPQGNQAISSGSPLAPNSNGFHFLTMQQPKTGIQSKLVQHQHLAIQHAGRLTRAVAEVPLGPQLEPQSGPCLTTKVVVVSSREGAPKKIGLFWPMVADEGGLSSTVRA
ncbi:hypothetical protein NDU88_001655 [Pleurodeles waltl]|uniref:Uncharacterized protein n=1 Tax=Pleurodeles waltl TaxID=8319 RepID=A0AAV7NE18_PLEWA|nr:hypothetical protein NDU88_001655 [Pleurodeles waltl]